MNTTNNETLACLIIDDPLLKPSYGCLNYETLLAEMKEHGFFTEIAFIPYNWKRSDARTVRLFAENPEYFAICVHGCDHTGNEFGKGSFEELSELAATAMWRMEWHKELTGLEHDKVMVFPRGQFSKSAIRALKEQGYLAAFNSTLRTTAGEQPPACEFKRPATMAYHDFPLFLRRDPDERAALQQDRDAGRPLLLVAHHSDFRHGYETITDTVEWINSQANVRWTSLSQIAQHYCKDLLRSDKVKQGSTALSPPRQHVSMRAAARRILSEVRDNYVEPNDLLRNAYVKVRQSLKRFA